MYRAARSGGQQLHREQALYIRRTMTNSGVMPQFYLPNVLAMYFADAGGSCSNARFFMFVFVPLH